MKKIYNKVNVQIIFCLSLVLLFYISTPNIYINNAKALEQFEYELENGLKITIVKDKNRNYTSLGVIYKVGGEMEMPYESGLAHLFEHLTFNNKTNGTHYIDVLEKSGIIGNAFTSNYRTVYHAHFPNHLIENVLKVESARMKSLDIDESILEKEKNIVIEELKLRDEFSLLQIMSHNMEDTFFARNKGALVSGYKACIENTSLNTVTNFYDIFYTPQNTEIFIIGNVNQKNTLSLIKKYFGNIKRTEKQKNEVIQEYNFNNVPVEKFIILETEEVPLNKLYMALEAPTINSADLKTNLAYVLLNNILLDGRSSMLYKHFIKDNKSALSIGSQYSILSPFHTSLAKSYFDINITMNGDIKPSIIKDELVLYIGNILSRKIEIDNTSLNRAKNQLISSILDSIDYSGPKEIFFLHLILKEIGIKADGIEKLKEEILNISVEDIYDALSKSFINKTKIFGYLQRP